MASCSYWLPQDFCVILPLKRQLPCFHGLLTRIALRSYKRSAFAFPVSQSPKISICPCLISQSEKMPIVGSIYVLPIGGNVSDWSHSTIFTTTTSTLESKNIPQLTTLWTPPTRCANRWMAPSEPITITLGTTVRGTTTFVTPTIYAHHLARIVLQATHTGSVSGSTRGPPVLASFVAFSTNPGNNPEPGALFDPLYSSCQPYAVPTVYSPGIRPEGQTVAEVTEYQYHPTSADIKTYFEASCCSRFAPLTLLFSIVFIKNIKWHDIWSSMGTRMHQQHLNSISNLCSIYNSHW